MFRLGILLCSFPKSGKANVAMPMSKAGDPLVSALELHLASAQLTNEVYRVIAYIRRNSQRGGHGLCSKF